MTELQKHARGAVQRIEELPENAALSTILRVALTDDRISADKIERLLAVQMQADAWSARKEFTAAFSRLQFPAIVKGKKGHTNKYAAFEDIQEVIDPILASEGFTLTFSSGEPNDKGYVPIIGKLAHRDGHFEEGRIYQPLTKATSAINDNQAVGSATSYGQRYVAKMMLNLRFIGEDDDAAKLGQITPDQRDSLERYLAACGVKESLVLTMYGLKALGDLQKTQFEPACIQVGAKYRATLKAQGCDEQDIREKVEKAWGAR